MKTATYVKHGTIVTDHLAPINATMFIATGTLLPIMDFLRPYFPYINFVAGAVVLFFVVLAIMKVLKVPPNRVIPSSMVFCAGVCAVAFSVGAVASSKHASDGGFIAAKSTDARALQANILNLEKHTQAINDKLTDIQAGKSSNPRVELANMGIQWDFYKFYEAAKRGDELVVDLFLKGGMPVTSAVGEHFTSIPKSVVITNLPNAGRLMEIFAKNGVDLNDQKLVARTGVPEPLTPPNLYAYAMREKSPVAEKLASLGVNTTGYPAWNQAMDTEDKKPKAYLSGI
ncbi:hypothetical protein [Variovorax sp. RA8]|uniref:hypothetical protein n=1 Tax=Variovorax sp. (strain JCM 16519 / RA8) TaxID=662548 RepID=UPI000A694DBC|nr:hypothetical protein [Variovorax sp. RA8]VTU34339.1 hypothetical protein RA8CHR_04954 [Variovorax sp. RA8]